MKNMKSITVTLVTLLLPAFVAAGEFDQNSKNDAPAGLIVRVDLETNEMTHFRAQEIHVGDLNDIEAAMQEIEFITEDANNLIEQSAVVGLDSDSEFDETSSSSAWYYHYRGPWRRYGYGQAYYQLPRYYYHRYHRYHYGWGYRWRRYRYHCYW